ncbi:MAG: hypothetical protein FWG20_00035 [Candidatus Cloacimonetes bacterium]|nr:hypothetical protein [Candidatus Cloacimonadota bacterium]
MTTVTIEISDDFKQRAEQYYHKKGKALSEAIIDLISQDIEEDDFDTNSSAFTEEEEASFYSPENIAYNLEGITQLVEGKKVLVTAEQLKAMIK